MFTPKYPLLNPLVTNLRDAIKSTLTDDLLGLYLFGSLVGGDFDPETSDIDLLAIVKETISEDELTSLAQMHTDFIRMHPEWDDRIEVAYVSRGAMREFKTNTVRIVRISPGEPLHYRDMDIAWLMDWYMVQELGVPLEGPGPESYIPSITTEEFVNSLKSEYPKWLDRAKEARWVGYQSYVILSLCRGLYAIRFGEQISKSKGAEWAMREYPQWSDLIKAATAWHGSEDKSGSLETQAQTIQFAEFMVSLV